MPTEVSQGTNHWAESAAQPHVAAALGQLFLRRSDRTLRIEPGRDFLTGAPRFHVQMGEQHVIHEDLGTALAILERKMP